jgi:hypothetical protein
MMDTCGFRRRGRAQLAEKPRKDKVEVSFLRPQCRKRSQDVINRHLRLH